MNSVEKVTVELKERSYDIIFDSLDSANVVASLATLPQKNILVVADSNTSIYLNKITSSLTIAGKTVYTWVFPAGEASKNIDNAMKLCAYASQLKLGRNALFAALGGGVTGDLTGFAASIYMRGVDFIQIPTSLLAMVDSSVGGKTAVDTPDGKNLVGAFHQPKLVIIDCNLLKTLPQREIACGMAEIVKTAMILDCNFAKELQSLTLDEILADLSKVKFAVKRSCEIKAQVVSQDEKETGLSGRVFLNYGHTFGHALESLSYEQGKPTLHGFAVAWGMLCELYLSHTRLAFPKEILLVYRQILKDFYGFYTINCKDYERIFELMTHDKKNESSQINFTLLSNIGEIKINQTATKDEIFEILDFYREVAP